MQINIKIPFIYLDVFQYDIEGVEIKYNKDFIIEINLEYVANNPFIKYLANKEKVLKDTKELLECSKELFALNIGRNLINNTFKYYCLVDCELSIKNPKKLFNKYLPKYQLKDSENNTHIFRTKKEYIKNYFIFYNKSFNESSIERDYWKERDNSAINPDIRDIIEDIYDLFEMQNLDSDIVDMINKHFWNLI